MEPTSEEQQEAIRTILYRRLNPIWSMQNALRDIAADTRFANLTTEVIVVALLDAFTHPPFDQYALEVNLDAARRLIKDGL